MASWSKTCANAAFWTFLIAAASLGGSAARAQLQFTEVMFSPGGDDALWEWVEVRNTSASPVNLHNWVFDDDDDPSISATAGANIKSINGNTIIPAGGVAVLYPGDELEFTPSRFTDAWGAGINLIAVDGFTTLTATDAIGLWPSYEAYAAAAIPGATSSPRRTFAGASATLNFTAGFPTAGNRRSIAWKGTGSATAGADWVASVAGAEGAPGPYREVVSIETNIPSAPVNDVADLGNPRVKPAGTAAAGLLITEIMFAPASPAATSGWTSADFEWVELYNNTAAPINFATKAHVFDDFEGEFDEPNVNAGAIPAGQLGILFNAEMLTPDDMAIMWGPGNYIPVDPWPSLNNSGGDTIAIWDDHDEYLGEAIDGDDHRAHASAIASVTYNTVAGQGWPTVSAGKSIFLNNLTANPNAGASWTRAGAVADTLGSVNPAPLLQTNVDHPGGDVGSPGTVGTASAAELVGDYNNDGRVDAADYTRWRNNFGGAGTTLNHRDMANSGPVGAGDYTSWKAHYGEGTGGGGLAAAENVPEPATAATFLVGLLSTALCQSRRRRG